MTTHVPMLTWKDKLIDGLKRCENCGMSETYWENFPKCGMNMSQLPRWFFGWRWSPRLWYWNFYYDGNHRVVQIIFLQIEYYS